MQVRKDEVPCALLAERMYVIVESLVGYSRLLSVSHSPAQLLVRHYFIGHLLQRNNNVRMYELIHTRKLQTINK